MKRSPGKGLPGGSWGCWGWLNEGKRLVGRPGSGAEGVAGRHIELNRSWALGGDIPQSA